MALIIAICILVGAVAALLITPASAPILGLEHGQFAALALGSAMLAFGLLQGRFRANFGNLPRVAGSALTWALLVLALTQLYRHRVEFGEVAAGWFDSFGEPEPTVGQGGEVTINARFGGGFQVAAKVDDRPVRFVLDTGASSVVLTSEDAARIGIDPRQLDFTAPVSTANGPAMAAPVRLAKISVGPIVVRQVRALVTRPGAMSESLLGMTFLEQLDSFTVQRGRVTLRAKRGA